MRISPVLMVNEFVIRLKKADDGMFVFSHKMELIERFFEAAIRISNFSAPLIDGVLWIFLSPTVPFVLVGRSGFIFVPIYAYGMRRYEQANCLKKCHKRVPMSKDISQQNGFPNTVTDLR